MSATPSREERQLVWAKGPVNLDERRRAALSEIDGAAFSWFHVKIVCVAGVGFFTGADDMFAVFIVATMLGIVFNNGSLTSGTNQDLGVKIATPTGSIVGQLFFGWLADVIGRQELRRSLAERGG